MPLPRLLRPICLLLLTAGAVACGGEAEPVTIDRATFVDAYVELRSAALRRGLSGVDGPLRDSVLREAGVTEEELLTFAEVHGGDLEFMQEVWTDVSLRLDSIPLQPVVADSAG